MTLSLEKLNEFISSYQLVVKEYFIYKNYCVFTKVLATETGYTFLLTFSSKYKFPLPSNYVPSSTYELKKLGASKRVMQEEDSYPVMSLNQSEDLNFKTSMSITEQLENHYKDSLSIPDISAETRNCLIRQESQLARFQHCFKHLPYKLALHQNNVISTTNSSNNVESFLIPKYPKNSMKVWIISIDIETLYSKGDTITSILPTLESNFLSLLDNNQRFHLAYTQNMGEFVKKSQELYHTKLQLKQQQKEFQQLISNIDEKEEELQNKLSQNNIRMKTYNQDVKRSKQTFKLERDLEELRQVRYELVNKSDEVDHQLRYLYILLDDMGFNLAKLMNEFLQEVQIFTE